MKLAKKQSLLLESYSTNVDTFGEDLQEVFYNLFCLRFCVSVQQRLYKEFEKDFYAEVIVTIIPKNFITNSLLSLFCLFLEAGNKSQVLRKLIVW